MQQLFAALLLVSFAKARIDFAKGPPALSRPHQALDNTPEFCGTKAGNKSVARNRTDVSNPTLEQKLREYFTNMHRKFPSCNCPSQLKDKLIQGLLTLVFLCREKYHTAEKLRSGFAVCGQHVKSADPAKGESTVDYQRIMSRTQAVVTPEELQHMDAVKEQVIEEFHLHGRVTDAFLDSIGVAQDYHHESRDDLTLCRQDAQLLTHEDTVARYLEKKAQKELKNNPAHILLEKQIKEAEKLVKQAAAAQHKDAQKAEKKAAAEAAKVAEKARLAGLTRAERAAEAATRKAEKLMATEAAVHAKTAALELAHDRLGPEKVAQIQAAMAVAHAAPAVVQHPVPPHQAAAVPVQEDGEEDGDSEELEIDGEEVDNMDLED